MVRLHAIERSISGVHESMGKGGQGGAARSRVGRADELYSCLLNGE